MLQQPHFQCDTESVATLFGLTAFDLARLLIVTAVAQFFEGAFLVELLFQTTQCAVDNFALFDADFSGHLDSPPFSILLIALHIIL